MVLPVPWGGPGEGVGKCPCGRWSQESGVSEERLGAVYRRTGAPLCEAGMPLELPLSGEGAGLCPQLSSPGWGGGWVTGQVSVSQSCAPAWSARAPSLARAVLWDHRLCVLSASNDLLVLLPHPLQCSPLPRGQTEARRRRRPWGS